MQTTTMMNTTALPNRGLKFSFGIANQLARNRRTRRFYLNLGVVALALAGTLPAWAATQTVTNTNDSGPGSLRDAIAAANPGDTIQFSVTGTITLTSGELPIGKNLTITGPGAAQLAISGNQKSRVFDIGAGATVAISGLTIENGSALGGGGISISDGTVMLTNSVVSGNSAQYGSGIFNGAAGESSSLTLINSTVSGNTAYTGGGGIFNNFGGRLTLINSVISGNSASGPTGLGGGLDNVGMLIVTNSTVAGNSAPLDGGLVNAGTLTIKSTLLAGNGTGTNCALNGGINTSQGYNISDDNSCASVFTAAGDENNVVKGAGLDPKGLQNNGGPTPTIALLPTSPAVDHIPVASCTDPQGNPITTDQRGIKRPQGAGCDVGSFELVQTVPFSSFNAQLTLLTGRQSGFVLTSWFTLGAASQGLQPLTEAVTLQIANYTVTLPAGSLHQLWNAPDAPYGYEGTVNGTHLILGLFPLGDNRYGFDAAGFPVTWTDVKNPVTVSLTIGQDTGSTTVDAHIRSY